jgi:F-type H+-transporting ATPase subunit c
MDPLAAKFLGAGLACIGMGGAAIGVANVFGQFLVGALRNPSAAGGERNTLFLGFALAEAFGIFSLLIALLLLFVL